MLFIKTYGIAKIASGKYAVCTGITEQGHKTIHPNLSYKKAEFALQKAEGFIRACHKNHVGFNGEKVEFEFKNYGLINGSF